MIVLERIEKMELILGRELESEYDFVLEYERLIKKTYQTKVGQLKTKINNNINSPYQSDEIDHVLPVIEQGAFVKDDGIVIIEHFCKKNIPDTMNVLKICRSYRYGDTMLTLYTKQSL